MEYRYIKKVKLSKEDILKIKKLENIIVEFDKVNLKLELEYKSMLSLNDKNLKAIAYLCYDKDELIGYLGVDDFAGHSIEVNGMVHPDYRRRKIFTSLFAIFKDYLSDENKDLVLLLSDTKSISGLGFISNLKVEFHHNEFEMILTPEKYRTESLDKENKNMLYLREATNQDSLEIHNQNQVYFHSNNEDKDLQLNEINPENEKAKGFYVYLAISQKQIVGKVNIQYNDLISGIYGLGVKPEYRSKGYGRSILQKAIKEIQDKTNSQIILQVEAENEKALHLYKSCGFETTYTMAYYEYLNN